MRTLLLLALLTLVAAPLQTAHAGDGLSSKSEKLLTQARKAFKSKPSEQRGKLLMRVAALSEPDPEHPSKSIAKALAIAANDKDPQFRLRALEALMKGRHQGTAITSAIDALGRLQADRKYYKETFKVSEEGHAYAPTALHLFLLVDIGKPVLIVGAFDDERCEDALIKLLKAKPAKLLRPEFEAAAQSLVAMGSARSIGAAINAWAKLEQALRRGPLKGLGGLTSSTIDDRHIEGVNLLPELYLQPPGPGSLRRLHDALAAHMLANELPTAPAWSNATKDLNKAWKAWQREHAAALPAALGKLPNDAPANPERPRLDPLTDNQKR